MAEIELNVLTRQYLDRRLPGLESVEREVLARQDRRNADVVEVHWQLTTADARIKLAHLYPKIEV